MPNIHRRRRRNSTVESSCVVSALWSRDPVYNFLYCWSIEFDKWRHNDVIVVKVINIDQNSRSLTAMESVWSVSKLLTVSVGSHRELVANCVHTCSHCRRRRDSTRQLRRVGVGFVYWALDYTTTTNGASWLHFFTCKT